MPFNDTSRPVNSSVRCASHGEGNSIVRAFVAIFIRFLIEFPYLATFN
jgi:hypothetical protein